MISFIAGKMALKTPAHIIIEAAGIGYHINISLYTYERLGNNENIKLHTHMVVREDAHILFGFIDEEERELFRHLISVSGVGPAIARVVLSAIQPNELKQAIISGNVALLKSVKGIGEKSAQRLIVELKDKVGKTEVGSPALEMQGGGIRQEARDALVALGFSPQQTEKSLQKVLKSNPQVNSVEELLKETLKVL